MSDLRIEDVVCPKCGSAHVGFSVPTKLLFTVRGSEFVRKRNVKFVVADWVCEDCGWKWSARTCVSGIRIYRKRQV